MGRLGGMAYPERLVHGLVVPVVMGIVGVAPRLPEQ